MPPLSDIAIVIVAGVLYQQALLRAPNWLGDLWELAASALVPAVLPIRPFIVAWDLSLTLLLAAIFLGLLVVCRSPLRWKKMLLFVLPIAFYQVWDYLVFWGSFGTAEPDYWRRMLNALAAVGLPIGLWQMLFWLSGKNKRGPGL